MRRWRVPCAIVVLSALCLPHASNAAQAPSDADITKSFEQRLAQLDGTDPKAPQALQTHLRYADYLARAQGQNCGARLSAAQSQLQTAQQNVAFSVVLPQGLARAADIDYQIHTALASCAGSSDASRRESELRAALESAQRAAALYRDTFDYPAMVTMQFNAAVTYQSLGEPFAAQTALQAAIDSDHTFGFRDDAEDNYRLLLRWQAAAPEQLAGLMRDFPQRLATLKFGWVPGDNAITLTTRSERVIGGAVVHASGARTLTRRVRRRPFGWDVTYQPIGAHYSLEPLPEGTGTESSFMTSLADMLLKFHDFSLKDTRSSMLGTGADFKGTINSDNYHALVQQEEHIRQEADALLETLQPQGNRTAALMPVLNQVLRDLRPAAVDADTALDYNLEAGAWAGATLEQGQWYAMKISLPLPYAPTTFVLNEVQFAFTRELPCRDDSSSRCVELVLRTVPDEKDLDRILHRMQNALHLRHGEAFHSSSTMYMRLIVELSTLQIYHRDTRQQFYVSLGFAPDGALLGAEQSIIDAEPVKPAGY